MFTVAMSPEFWATVKAQYTGEDGKAITGSFGMKCKRHDRVALKKLRDDLLDEVAKGDITDADEEFLKRVVTGFKGIAVTDPEYGSIASDDFDKMMDFLLARGFASAMNKAYLDEYPRTRAKN